MQVFIEKSANVPYVLSTGTTWVPPYPYGYIVGTKAADGVELDCFVITATALEEGSTVECRAVGLMEQFEEGVEDHNVLVVPEGEGGVVTGEVEQKLRAAFTGASRIRIGKFLGSAEAEAEIAKSSAHPR